MAKFLDNNGLLYLWSKIKEKFVAKETGKGLSTNDFTTELKNKLNGIEAGAQANVKPDWSASAGAASEILNKPSIPSKTSDLQNDSGFITSTDIPEGAAASTTVPKMAGVAAVGTEMAFARGDHVHPSDTSKADKATTLAGYGIKDAYTKSEIDGKGFLVDSDIENKADKATTLAGYGIADAYTKTETYAKTEVYNKNEVDGKLSSVYKPAGNTTFANLPTPSASNLGNVYNMNEAFTTDDRFLASEPTQYPIGTNVVVVQVDSAYYFDVLAGFVDLSGYMEVSDMVAITNGEIDKIAV